MQPTVSLSALTHTFGPSVGHPVECLQIINTSFQLFMMHLTVYTTYSITNAKS